MQSISIPVNGMRCSTRASKLEEKLNKLSGIQKSHVNLMTKKVYLEYDPNKIGLPDFEKVIEDSGFKVGYKYYPNIFERFRDWFRSKY